MRRMEVKDVFLPSVTTKHNLSMKRGLVKIIH